MHLYNREESRADKNTEIWQTIPEWNVQSYTLSHVFSMDSSRKYWNHENTERRLFSAYKQTIHEKRNIDNENTLNYSY